MGTWATDEKGTASLVSRLVGFGTLSSEEAKKVLADAKAHRSGQHADDTRPLADGGLGPVAYSDAVATYLALIFSRTTDRQSSICTWDSSSKMQAELSPNLGDGRSDQAAAVAGWGWAFFGTTSIPSANFTPRISFGNWA